MGDRSPKDNLRQGNRETMFDQFLAYVADQRGQLVLLGDVFELLRYPLDNIVARRRDLLDRLARMDTVYVPGNHIRTSRPSSVPTICPIRSSRGPPLRSCTKWAIPDSNSCTDTKSTR
ncbi:MAG TPA: hypothetical protein PKZ07_06505 [Sedimentisphaerales bacterium]|nr:hypothetical protein [Sedimentisphaerales bacterium]